MSVTLTQLRYLVAIADVRHFTRAADLVGVAQPTLSRQLKALETELGAELVDRAGRDGPRLTPAGEAVLPLARRMLADLDSARTAVAEIVGLRSGRLRVGATPSLCMGVLADVLRTFHDRYPRLRLELMESGSRPLVRSLVRGELDLALVIVPPTGIDPALESTPILRERLSVASPAGERPLSTRGSVTVRDLARRPLVVPRTGYDVRETTLTAFADAGVLPRFAVQGGEMDAVLRLVEAGTGVAVVPDLVFAGRPGLRRTVLSPPLYRTVALARRADLAPSHAMRAFQDTLLAFLAEPSTELPGEVQVLGLAEGPM
jgi:DNA-binding transcriptional LysR family regulator